MADPADAERGVVRRALITCHVDPFYRPNNRIHHLIDGLAPYFDELTVVYLQHVHNETLASKLRSFFSLGVVDRHEAGVTYIGVNPLFSPGHFQRAMVDRTVPVATHLRRHPLKTVLLELVGIAGFVLEWTYVGSLYAALARRTRARFDVVVGQSLSPLGLTALLARRGRAGVTVADDFDYIPGNYINSTLRAKLVRARENALLRAMDVIISVGDALGSLREAETGHPVHVIPNGIDHARFATAQSKPPHPPTVIHVGTLIEWAGLDLAIPAFRRVVEQVPDARMIIVGQGYPYYIEHLRELIRTCGLEDRIDFRGEVPNEQLHEVLREVDVGLAVFQPIALRRFAFSMKVVEYLGAGVCPIVTTGLDSGDFVEQHGCGRTCEYTEDAIASAMVELLTRPDERARYVASGARVTARMDWTALMSQYMQAIEAAAHGAGDATR